MAAEALDLARRAAELRQAFDRSFAEAPSEGREAQEDHLAIRLDADPHAIRRADVSLLLPLKTVTRVPGPVPELMGIVALQGDIVPVYDLRMLCGYPSRGTASWLVRAAGGVPVALAFDAFDGYLRHPGGSCTRQPDARPPQRHVQEILQTAEGAWPVVSMSSVLEAIQSAARRRAPLKER